MRLPGMRFAHRRWTSNWARLSGDDMTAVQVAMGSRSRSAAASVLVVDRLVVIVNVRLLVVILVLLGGIVVVAMKERRVVVLMAVIVGAVLELAERTAGVVVRHVVVIVTMHLCGVQMLLLIRLAANGCLSAGACSLVRHRWLPSQYVVIVPPCRTDADIPAPEQALRFRSSARSSSDRRTRSTNRA